MRNLLIGLAFLLGIALPQCASAQGPAAMSSSSPRIGATTGGELRALLEKFDLNPIAKAHAAECAEEGENCTSTAQCCSGLECAGAPEATCQPAD